MRVSSTWARRGTPSWQTRPATGAARVAGAFWTWAAAELLAPEPAAAGLAVEAGIAEAHSPMRWKPLPTTSQTASAGASTINAPDSLDMSRACTTARLLAIPGEGIVARSSACDTADNDRGASRQSVWRAPTAVAPSPRHQPACPRHRGRIDPATPVFPGDGPVASQ